MAIGGAGIAGLAAALALADAGLRVTLFDRAPVMGEAGAGLQLSPNATRLLGRLGVLDRVMDGAVKVEAIRIRRGRDGADLARLPLGNRAEARFGAPFLVLHRADLQAALLGAALTHPSVTLATGHAVEGFALAGAQVVVAMRSGAGESRTLAADGLIGADGLRSVVRAALNGSIDPAVYCGRTAWRALVPAADAPTFCRQQTSNLWLGRKAHLVHYPVRDGSLINVAAIVHDDWRGDTLSDLWAVPGEPARLRRSFAGWCTDVRQLIDAAGDWRVWPLFDRPPLRVWSKGRVTLVGDAAHPMLPFLAQGASQAIEDGWALGQAVRARPDDLPVAFKTYETARKPKADRVQRESRRQGTIYHLSGAASVVRDLGLRALGPERMLARYDWLYGVAPRS